MHFSAAEIEAMEFSNMLWWLVVVAQEDDQRVAEDLPGQAGQVVCWMVHGRASVAGRRR